MAFKSQFYDPLYDFVTLEDAEEGTEDSMAIFDPEFSKKSKRPKKQTKKILPFLDTFEVSRLSFLRQSGLAFLVYPSSTHTRFSHSVGCCYLGFMACEEISVETIRKDQKDKGKDRLETVYLSQWLEDRNWKEEFLLALLLHDIGHFPFSHTIESNGEFWLHFPKIDEGGKKRDLTHEDIASGLILGDKEESLKINGKHIFERFHEHIDSRFSLGDAQTEYQFVHQLIGNHLDIDVNVLCYLISGRRVHLSAIKEDMRKDVDLLQDLVSGLLDLDRIDHYRRDSYFTGLRFGSNLNFASLMSGMTMHFDPRTESEGGLGFQMRLSADAIGHALTLLQAKDRLVHDCFENPLNMAYEAMLHLAINLLFRLNELSANEIMESATIERAADLFFMTDDELLSILIESKDKRVKTLASRIINRRPYCHVGRAVFTVEDVPSLKEIRENLAHDSGLSESEIAVRASKAFGRTPTMAKEWMALKRLYDLAGTPLEKLDDYEAQIAYLKTVQDSPPKMVWYFTAREDKKDDLIKLIRSEKIKYGKLIE